MELQIIIDWTQFPLDIEEEEDTCPPFTHQDSQAASTTIDLDPPIGIEVLPQPKWKRLHPKESKPSSLMTQGKNVYKIPSRACREKVSYDKDIIGWFHKINTQHIDLSYDDFLPLFLCPKHIQLFTPISKFVPLDYGHQALPLTKDDIYNVGMTMMQCGLTDQWPSYPSGIHIRRTTTSKFMSDHIALALPTLDLRKKKGKVPPQNKSMPYQGLKDNAALRPIPYD